MYKYIFFLVVFIFSNKYFYILAMKIKGIFFKYKKLENKNFEEGIFLVSLPTNDYKLYTSLPKDFKVIYDFNNFLFPSFQGVKVYYKNKNEKKLVFYIKLNKNFFNESHHLKEEFISYMMSKKYKNQLKQEICRKLRERETSLKKLNI